MASTRRRAAGKTIIGLTAYAVFGALPNSEAHAFETPPPPEGSAARLAQKLPRLWADYDAAPLEMGASNAAYEAIDDQENAVLAAAPQTVADALAVLLITTSRLYGIGGSVIDDDDGPVLEMLANVQSRAIRLLADRTSCDLRPFAVEQYTRCEDGIGEGRTP